MDKIGSNSNPIEGLFYSESFYDSFFNELDECRVFTDSNIILDCNLATLSLFNFEKKADIVGKNISELFSGKDQRSSVLSAFELLISEAGEKGKASGPFLFIKANKIQFEGQLKLTLIENSTSPLFLVSIEKTGKDDEEWLSGSLFQNILDSFQQPVFIKNSQLIYLNCNQAFADYLGRSRDEIIGATVFEVVDESQAKTYNAADIELYKSGNNATYESKILLADGQERDAIFRKILINNDLGNKVGIIGIIDDVTDLRRFQAALTRNERKYRMIFDNVQDVYYRSDLDGTMTDISPSIKRYSKYIPEDIVGQSIEKFYNNPDDRKRIIEEVFKKGEVNDFEVLLKTKNEEVLWASVNAHFTFDENGNVNGLEGTLRDITERKQAEYELKRSISLLQTTLDSTINGILAVDLNGNITSFNKRFKEIFQHKDGVLESKSDNTAIEAVLKLLKEPKQFISKIKYLYNHPELESNDRIELIDGRILERYSGPQLLDDKPIGRIWSFTDITERVKTEEQLLLMAHTLKSVSEAISITDTKNQLLFVNSAFEKTYGYSKEELIGKNISIVRVSNYDVEKYREIQTETLKKGWQGEILNQRKDGTIFPVLLSSSAVQNESGEIIAMVGVATDITESKGIELKLRESEERYRTFFEGSPDAIILADTETGIVVDANDAASRLLKKPLEDIIGIHHSLLHPKNMEEFSKKTFNMKADQTVELQKITENSVQCSDGSVIPVEILANIIHINGRSVLQGVFRNTTERKNAEKLLQESEQRYRTLFESMPDGVYRSTPDGKFVQINQAMVNMLGYASKEELMSIDIKTDLYFKPEDRDNLMLNLEPSDLDEYTLKKKDGAAVWVEDHSWYVRDENGKILFHEGITRDITERKQAELKLKNYSDELKELNATKDKFFSIIAHDLKNPFNSISGLSEIIKNEARYLDISAIEEYAKTINSTSNNTLRLLENLLDWARVKQSKMPFNPESLVLNTLVNEVLELMIDNAKRKSIQIENKIRNNLIVSADKNMLETILRNLLSNALKFTKPHGRIELDAIDKKTEIEVSVTDSGMGINEEDIPKIFRIDTNFSTRGTENEKGTGLGLLLCKEFVELHNGRIVVTSKVGKGSTFTFTLDQTKTTKKI